MSRQAFSKTSTEPAETVDALLAVADEEELSWWGRLAGSSQPASAKEQVDWKGSYVLGFIDEELLHPGGEAVPYVGICDDELVGVIEEVGEIQEALLAFLVRRSWRRSRQGLQGRRGPGLTFRRHRLVVRSRLRTGRRIRVAFAGGADLLEGFAAAPGFG